MHSGPHPVMVSGMGMSPASHRQIALPELVIIQRAPGPQGLGVQGSGLSWHRWPRHTCPRLHSKSATHSGPQPVIVSGLGTRPGLHWQIAFPGHVGHQTEV